MFVCALVGKSGSGKSYRALNVAYENNLDYIIDDGLLIHKNKVMNGISAKSANTKMQAVKRAIFEDINYRDDMKNHIKSYNIKSILIIGTSNKMVSKIASRLELGNIDKIIQITDIATISQIEKAIEIRKKSGTHIVPLPMPEVKEHFSGIFKKQIDIFLGKENNKNLEKTVVRPTFSCYGKYFISKKVIYQIIHHECRKMDFIKNVLCKKIVRLNAGIEIFLDVELENCNIYNSCNHIQVKLRNTLENITFLNILKINIRVSKFYQR